MNVPDKYLDLASGDGELLATVDRALAEPRLVTAEPASLDEFSAHLAATAPVADPLFRNLLEQRLKAQLKARPERLELVARLRSLFARCRVGRTATSSLQLPRRWRLASLALTVLIVGGGAGTYFREQAPTPVDAQTVLHRAATSSPGPNEATHSTYRLSASGGLTGTAEVWIGFDATGTATQLALTETMSKSGSSAADFSTNIAASGESLFQIYDAKRPTIETSPGATPGQAMEGMFVGTLLGQKLSRQPDAFRLHRETLDGVPVYALTLDTPSIQTYYFNAQTYVLEGADWTQDGKTWQARLDTSSYRFMPISAVPANTFPATSGGDAVTHITARATAHAGTGGVVTMSGGGPDTSGPHLTSGSPSGGLSISMSQGGPAGSGPQLTISASVPGLSGSGVDLTPALAAACNTTPQAFAHALLGSSQSIKATCQLTNPSISVDRLVAALLVPVQSALDVQVRFGAITQEQETNELVATRVRLAHLVTSDIGMKTSGPPPDISQP